MTDDFALDILPTRHLIHTLTLFSLPDFIFCVSNRVNRVLAPFILFSFSKGKKHNFKKKKQQTNIFQGLPLPRREVCFLLISASLGMGYGP